MEVQAEISKKMKKSLNLKSIPVAISFSNKPPEGIEPLNGKLRLCQMVDKVRLEGSSFYTTVKNHQCDGGSGSSGMKEMSEKIKNGEFLCKLGLFGTDRAARRFIASNPRIPSGTVKIVTFAPLGKAGFEPDVVVFLCNARQGMLIAESFAYNTGKRTLGMTGPPICSAVVAAPYLTGEITYSFGDHGAREYMKVSDGEAYVGIPTELLTEVADNIDKVNF